MLNHASLFRVQTQALFQRAFGLGVILERFLHPADVIEGRTQELAFVLGNLWRTADQTSPGLQRTIGFATLLKNQTQVDIGAREILVGFDEDVLMACGLNAMLDQFDGVRWLVLHLEF